MHGKQVSHGDVYAHNMMVNQQMALLFGDFGAASNLAKLPTSERDAMQAIEVRALGCLLDDLLPFADNDEDDALRVQLRQLKAHCMQPALSCRPRFSDIVKTLAALR